MTFTDKQIEMLSQPLDPKNIVKPSGKFGPKGDYIEGWHAMAEANRIFGYGNWSYLIQLTKDSVELGENSKNHPQWQAIYTCICTVHVGEITRQGAGLGTGFAKGKSDAIEGAIKEAETDALKRALRSFGNQFGLALYDKKRDNVGVSIISSENTEKIKELCQTANVTQEQIKERYKVDDLARLTMAQSEKAINQLNATIDKNNQKDAA